MFGIAIQKIENGAITFEDMSFKNLSEMEKFHVNTVDSCHYEIISGKQCLYFDFDGSVALDFKSLISSIIKNVGNKVKIILYESCGKIKFSYHVIVRGIYLENHVACGILAKRIISDCDNEISKAFDSSVYTSRRNLRMIGSRKIDSMRVKKFHSILYEKSDIAESCPTESRFAESRFAESRFADSRFADSLVSNVSDGKLFQIVIETVKHDHEKTSWSDENIETVKKYLDDNYLGIFSVVKHGDFLILKREKTGYCHSCNRHHTAENAYVIKKKEKLFFVCRRNNEVHIPIEDDSDMLFEVMVIDEKKVNDKKEKTLAIVKNMFSF